MLSAVLAMILTLSLFISAIPVFAAEPNGNQTVRVGYVLFENYQEGGEGEYKRGFGYEYLQRISYATGWKYEYVYGSFSELLDKLKKGEIDLMGDLSYTEERAESISFSALPQGKENYYILITGEQTGIDTVDLDTLNGRRIGVTANSFQEELLKSWLAEGSYRCKIVEYPSSAEAEAALLDGRVDAMVMTDMASSGGYVPVVCIGHSDFYFGVAKDRPDLLKELNQAMNEIQSTNLYYNDVTYAKYITSSLSNAYLNKKERIWLQEHQNTVRLGYLKGNLPYSDQAADGKLKGLLSVLVDTFQEEFGIRVETKAYATVDELKAAVQAKEIDLFGPYFSDLWLAEQSGLFFTDSIASTSMILLYKDDDTEDITSKIAYTRDNAIQLGAMRVIYPDAEYVECADKEACLEAIMNGDATCTLISSATMNIFRQYRAMKYLRFLELPQGTDICLGTLRGEGELLNITNRVIFASAENLKGAALMENSCTEVRLSFQDYLEEHSMVVILVLLCIIALLVTFFIYYRNNTHRIMKMQQKNAELSRQVFRDGLTRVGNRAGYLVEEAKLQEQIEKAEAQPFALLVADVNSLKLVNDTMGHEVGIY